MSPARSKQTANPRRRERIEIVRAVGVAAAIIFATAVLVWLMRPGSVNAAGTGGMMSRQPRSSTLVIGTLIVGGIVTWWVLRVSKRARGHEQVVLPVALGVVLLVAIIVGIIWPGGLLRRAVALPPLPPATATTTTTAPTATTGATGTSSTTPTTGPTAGTVTTTIP